MLVTRRRRMLRSMLRWSIAISWRMLRLHIIRGRRLSEAPLVPIPAWMWRSIALLVIRLIGCADLKGRRRVGNLIIRIMLRWLGKVLVILHIRNLLLVNGVRIRSRQILMRITGHRNRSCGHAIARGWRVSWSWSRRRRWLVVRGKRVIWLEALMNGRQSILLVRHVIVVRGHQAEIQAGKLVGAIQIRLRVMVIEIQIHGLRLVARGRDLKVRAIELQVLEVIQGKAGLLQVRRKRGFRIAEMRRRRRVWGSILDLGLSLDSATHLGALAQSVGRLATIANEFLCRRH